MNNKIPLAIAATLSLTGLAMSAMAGLARGGSVAEQVVWVVCSLAICAAVHLFPALYRRASPIYGVWALGFLVVIASHISFLSTSERHADQSRVTTSTARAATLVAEELSKETKRLARMAYLPDDKKAAQVSLVTQLSNELDMAKQAEAATAAKTADPFGMRVSRATGFGLDAVMLGLYLLTAFVLEVFAPVMWWIALAENQQTKPPQNSKSQSCDDSQEKTKPKTKQAATTTPRKPRAKKPMPPLEEVVKLVKDGGVKCNVVNIRAALGCSQKTATSLTREVKAAIKGPDLFANA